jgi:hypothetical protein
MCTSSPPRSSRYQTWTDRSSPHYVRNAHDFRLKSHAFFFARDASRAIGLLFEAAGSVGSASGTLLAFQSEQLTRRGSFVTSSRHETFNARSLVRTESSSFRSIPYAWLNPKLSPKSCVSCVVPRMLPVLGFPNLTRFMETRARTVIFSTPTNLTLTVNVSRKNGDGPLLAFTLIFEAEAKEKVRNC